ncbi:TetR/AcrR family transcriptional regulator [Catenulispora sp. GP43]|uniref:TetR/AcrR family transcriptional regulator n=1 Tax=Catenulispora sp. GP43 TaxID=3156263 RepID=UPI0035126ADA
MAQEEAIPARRAAASRAARDDREVREAILTATRRLLDERRFDELSVADILAAAGVARGSFYFYFAGKHQVLAELTRRAVARGQTAAEPWLAATDDPRETIRHGISEGAKLWRAEAPVLRAVVENWRSDPELGELWLSLMAGFTGATAERIAADQGAGAGAGAGADTSAGVDTEHLAAALTWLGERLYYLAAIGVEPFADEEALVDVLTHIWMSVLHPTGHR